MSAPVATAATYPTGFQQSTIFSGLNHPTVVRFASDGRVFVAEKGGLVKVFQGLTDTNAPTVFADLHVAVHDYWDRGLLGLALHPDFPTTPYVYVLYTLNKKPGGTIPSWSDVQGNDTCPDKDASNNVIGPGATVDGCPVTARLSRLTASGSAMVPGSEVVLLETWCQQFPSHSVGSLQFGPEGALYLSAGEGSNFLIPDWGQFGGTRPDGQGGFYTPKNVCGDPPGGVGDPSNLMNAPNAEGGALRAQSVRRSDGPALLNGSLIRIDPATATGWPTNPLDASSDANAKRIVAYGLRNPFRFTLRPGSSEVWVGDVGWDHWEEIDRVSDPTSGPANFGWPCYEGGHGQSVRQSGYESAGLALCSGLYAAGDTAVTAPVFAYQHVEEVVSGDGCSVPGQSASSSIAGLAFYTANSYPADYQGALFFTDYSRRCIWAMKANGSGDPDPTQVVPFGQGLSGGAVDLETGPGGDLFFPNYDGGTIERVRYFAGNVPPTAVATADVTSGALPLTIHFSAAASSDPNDAFGTLTFEWDLDGDGSYETTGVSPTQVYSVAGPVTVHLRVTDPGGAQGAASLVVKPGNLAPTITSFAPASGLAWKVGDSIPFSATATDAEDGALPASAFSWSILMHHCPSNCHVHVVQDVTGALGGTFAAPDHEYPSYLEIQLTVTDSGGLTASQSVSLQPQTVDLSFVSDPPGLSIGVNAETGAAPFTRTVIVGSATAVTAPSPQTSGPNTYNFVSWSDGGAQNHNVTAPTAPASYTATFTLDPVADLSITNTDGRSLVTAGDALTYTITVSNAGPYGVTAAPVTDTFPPALGGVSWTCLGAGGGSCASPSGSGNIATTVDLPAGGSARFTVAASVAASAGGSMTNTASISAPGSTIDPSSSNDAATDLDHVVPGLSAVRFSAPDYRVAEGGTASIAVLRKDASAALDVDYVISDGTAHGGTDYDSTQPTGVLSFKKGARSLAFKVKTLANTRADGSRTVLLSLGGYAGGLATAILTIEDDDTGGTIQFGAPSFTVNEGDATALIKVTRAKGTASGVTASFTATSDGTTAGGTATPGADYTEILAQPLTFAARQTSVTVPVSIHPDAGAPEDHKTVRLALDDPGAGAALGRQTTATLTILEDNPVIQFAAASFTASESAARGIVTVRRSGPTADVVTVHYATDDPVAPTPGQAVPGTDYTPTSGDLTFKKGQTSLSFQVPLANDQAHETPRTILLKLTLPANATNPGVVELGQQDTTILTIDDNDKVPTVQFGAKAYSVTEAGKGADRIVVTRRGATGTTIRVDYEATDETAASGTNYDLAPGTLSFGPGVISLPIPVTIHNVADASNSTFKLELLNPMTADNGQAVAELGAPREAEVTIQSDDPLVQFSAAAYKVDEAGPRATITVKRSGSRAAQSSVHYDASGGDAAAGVDYTPVSGDLTFDPGVTSVTFDVPVMDGALVQKDKTVELTLSAAAGAGLGPISQAVLTLVSDDPSVAFSRDGFKVSETARKATISVKRIGNKNVPFTVAFSTADDTAIEGVNYTDASTTLHFPKGASSRSISIPILHDTADNAPPVTVDLALDAPAGATLGAPSTAALVIDDKDVAGTVQFSASDFSVSETGFAAVITVTRTGGKAGDVTVDWATSDGVEGSAATAGVNYTASSGTVLFAADQTSAIFTVDVQGDGVAAGSKTVTLELSNPQGGATLGARDTATLWIADSE